MRIIIYWHIFYSSGFHHICNIKCRLDCRYSPQNIFNAKNFDPHKKPISLLNVPICTQGMQRTWWPEAGTIIVTGPYSAARRRNQIEAFPRYWFFARRIHRSSVHSPEKGQWRGDLIFSLICTRTNDWTIKTPVIWDVIALIMTLH